MFARVWSRAAIDRTHTSVHGSKRVLAWSLAAGYGFDTSGPRRTDDRAATWIRLAPADPSRTLVPTSAQPVDGPSMGYSLRPATTRPAGVTARYWGTRRFGHPKVYLLRARANNLRFAAPRADHGAMAVLWAGGA
jgi:hypothetical protein